MHSIKNERRSGGPDRFKDRSGSRAKQDFGNRDAGVKDASTNRENGGPDDADSRGKQEHGHSQHNQSQRDSRPNRDRYDKGFKEMKRELKEEDGQGLNNPTEGGEKKFTGRCRLFVGNISSDLSEEEFKKLFEEYGEVSEVYANPSRGFGFIRMDTRANAEAAKKGLDGTSRKGRLLRVRFAAHSAALKVKYLPAHVTNELLEKAFSQFGEVERAIVIGDDRGKSVGEGIVEFARKTGAQQALNRINNGVFLLGVQPRPIVVEVLEQRDEEDGVSEKFQQKFPNSREREREPGFAEPGTFEFEYGQKWKDLYNLEKQREEQLKREMEEAFMKLESDMEGAEQEYQTVLLRQDLMRRQEELRRLEEEMARRRLQNRMPVDTGRKDEMRQGFNRDVDDDRRRQEMIMRQQQEEMRRRELEHRGMRGRDDHERELLMQQQQAIREMQDHGGRPQSGAPPMPPPPAPPAALGIEKHGQGGHMREQSMNQQHTGPGMGQIGVQGQPHMRQSRFDQPPQQAMFNQMGNQNPAMQNMSQGPMRSQGMGQGGQQGGQQMDRNRDRAREYFDEPKRPRRY